MKLGINQESFERHFTKGNGCWIWTGTIFQASGYGQYSRVEPLAHRAAWRLYRGEIPTGMTIDHVKELCTSKLCVNPDHLEVVTYYENNRRSSNYVGATHCIHGHEFTEENTYRQPCNGQRVCRTCKKVRARQRRAS